jgi:hypothetical protein
MAEHITRTKNVKGEPIDIVNKIVAGRYELFDTITVGDRVQTWDGIWGTVAAFVPTTRVCADGEVRMFGADMLIYVDHLPYGYRFEAGRNLVRHVEKYSSELYQCYTVRPVSA